MKTVGFLLLLLLGKQAVAQTLVAAGADTTDERIKTASTFLVSYLDAFANHQRPSYRKYWSAADNRRSPMPDDMVYSIADDFPTYRFGGNKPVIFYAKPYDSYVHLKTLFASSDSNGIIQPWAITNHYVTRDSATGQPCFISELELHKEDYRTLKNRNITYHFPASAPFSYTVSNSMLERLEKIEQQWGFKPIALDYYYAPSADALARMRGMDYNFAMDNMEPSGITYPQQRKLFCQGSGEGYLHEVLHVYFNPIYQQSPMCHALIYYLAGGLGKDFNWFVRRMNTYLEEYPDTDLSLYETLRSKDRMLHLDYTVEGLLLKMIDEKDGVAGLKRALRYNTVDELLEKEFGIAPKNMNTFLRERFRQYGKAG
jgi:hypothetical protein